MLADNKFYYLIKNILHKVQSSIIDRSDEFQKFTLAKWKPAIKS